MADVGSIHSEEAYALGKMLDHSAWQKGERKLPRGITGSDVDAVFDNDGRILFVELSRDHNEWDVLQQGQRLVYQALLRGTPHCAALCRHGITPEPGKTICTRADVTSFQPMVDDFGTVILGKVVQGNDHWQKFVHQWFEDPARLRRRIIEKAATRCKS